MPCILHRWLKLYRLVDGFVVPSTFMKTCLMAGGFPGEKIHVIRTPVLQSAEPVRADKRHILYFGRIAFEKGLDTLIAAYQNSGIGPDLILAGRSYDGEKERLQRLIRPQWCDRIHFVGFQEGLALQQLIGEALFTVLPSRWYDNAPQSLCESMDRGVPVLASQIGAIPEQVLDGVTGRLFTPDDQGALVAALRWMASDPARLERMGTAGRDFVRVHHSIERHATELLQLFDRLVDGSSRKSTRSRLDGD
ncbi:MAG: glycosyltransferase family 4 protein [Syntrophobacteraceae bacterium]